MGKYLTEFVGAFFLVLTIGLSGLTAPALAPLAIGCALMVMVYMGGHVSGAHYNPAVTLGVAVRGKCKWLDVIPYWLAQFLGSAAAAYLIFLLLNKPLIVQPGPEYLVGRGLWFALCIEALYAFALTLVVLNVATSKKTAGNSYFGLAIGFTVLAGAVAGGSISGGAFNPAVGIGPWAVNAVLNQVLDYSIVWIYLAGPFAGAILATIVFRVQNPEDFAA